MNHRNVKRVKDPKACRDCAECVKEDNGARPVTYRCRLHPIRAQKDVVCSGFVPKGVVKENDDKTNAKSADLTARWCHIGIDLFYADVLVFVGSRIQMMKSGAEYMHKASGWSDDKIDKIGKELAKVLPFGEDEKLCGESLSVDAPDGLLYFIRLDSFMPTSQDISILSHECLHTALSMHRDTRIKECDGHESLCYLHEYIFKNALEGCTDMFNNGTL